MKHNTSNKLKATKRRRKKEYVNAFIQKQQPRELCIIKKRCPNINEIINEDSKVLLEAAVLVNM